MITDFSEEAVEYGRQARRAIEAAGGDALLQQAEADPSRRAELASPVLAELGAWDIDPRGSADELEAAAVLCRSAGYWGLPYPVAERLARTAGDQGLLVVAERTPAAPLEGLDGLDGSWAAVGLDGRRFSAEPRAFVASSRNAAFVVDLDLATVDGIDDGGAADLALGLVLPCFTLLGMLDRIVRITCDYVGQREQFGQPLASFQSVQFQLTDAELERVGVEELAKFALWSLGARPDDAVADALALRMAVIEAAEVVFRVGHQLHGAIGFCDEAPVSWLSRHSQPLRRLPLGLSATRAALVRQSGPIGLTGLFG